MSWESESDELASRVGSSATSQEDLSLLVGSSELLMKALQSAADKGDKIRLKKKCEVLLRRAESLKATLKSSPTHLRGEDGSQMRPAAKVETEMPSQVSQLSTREQVILLRSSKVNGFTFPPWQPTADHIDFALSSGEERFRKLGLSKEQLAQFDDWKRPDDVFCSRDPSEPKMCPTMVAENPIDLVQDVMPDCSIVAGLSAIASRRLEKVLPTLFSPYDFDADRPRMSDNGKYMMRLNFNGCFRKVIVDDYLPTLKVPRCLHVIDRNNPGLLWPALVEKACLKVRGGYNCAGSNAGTDLWMLTGWIPEQVFLQSSESGLDQLWQRLYDPFQNKNVLITMGTGHLTAEEEAEFDLTSKHDYAILQLKKESGRYVALVKNPWCISDGPNKILRYCRALQGTENAAQELDLEMSALSLSKSGLFWIDVEDIPQYFENLYLNWNPELFSYRRDTHFAWRIEESPSGSCRENPQYTLTSPDNGGTVWLLLQRHSSMRAEEFVDARADQDVLLQSEMEQSSPFISLCVFDADGTRVLASDGPVHQGPYVDTPQALLQFEMPPRTTYTVVASHEGLVVGTSHSFSLSAFASCLMSLEPAHDRYHHWASHEAAWSSSPLGGQGSSFAMQSEDPQFRLQIEQRSDVVFALETLHEDIPIRVALLWCGGNSGKTAPHSIGKTNRASTTNSRDMVGDSGEYRRGGCAVADFCDLKKGEYIVICSTFEGIRQHGRCKFTLHVGCNSAPCILQRLPSETAGRLSTRLSAVFPPGRTILAAPLWCSRLTRLKVFARYRQPCGPAQQAAAPDTESHLTIQRSAPAHEAETRALSPLRASLRSNPPRPSDAPKEGPQDALAISNDGHFSNVLARNASSSTILMTQDVDIIPEIHHRRQSAQSTLGQQTQPDLSGSYRSGHETAGPLPLWIVLERQAIASASISPIASDGGLPSSDQGGQAREKRSENVVEVEILSDHKVEAGTFQAY